MPIYGTLSGGSVTVNVLDTGNQDGTGDLQLPTGNTAQRPSSAVAGMIRYNTSNNATEVYTGSTWSTIRVFF
jgi:hypothetical protein